MDIRLQSADRDNINSTAKTDKREQDAKLEEVEVVAAVDEDEGKSNLKIRKESQIRLILFIVSITISFFFTGAFYGWGPMQLLLEENGAFHSQCDNMNQKEDDENIFKDDICEKQTIKLINVQMIAQLNLIFAPIFGFVSDVYGATKLAHFMAVASVTGWIIVIIAVSKHIDTLLYFGFFLQGTMTIASNTLMVQTAVLFPFEGQGLTVTRVTALVNTSFDAGAITYLGLWAFKNHLLPNPSASSLVTTLSLYLGIAIIIFAGNSYLWNIVTPCDANRHEMKDDNLSIENIVDNVDSEQSITRIHDHDSQDLLSTTSQSSQVSTSLKLSYIPIAKRPVMKQLLSSQHIYLLFFTMIHKARNIFVLTTARDFLAFFGDDERGNKFLSIFTLLTPASILGVPIVDYILRRYGHHGGLQLVNILGISHGVITVISSNLNVQIIGFVLFSFYRCFLFTVIFSFGPTFLASDVVGRGAGMMVFIAGFFSFVNIPLKNWAIYHLDGDFKGPYLIYLCSMVPCVVAGWRMGEGIKREQRAKDS